MRRDIEPCLVMALHNYKQLVKIIGWHLESRCKSSKLWHVDRLAIGGANNAQPPHSS